jgi:hypothetical protein
MRRTADDHKILQIHTLPWDCTSNSTKAKQFNLESNALK